MKKLNIILFLTLIASALFGVDADDDATYGPYNVVAGKTYIFTVDGTFDSATFDVQYKHGTGWLSVPFNVGDTNGEGNPFAAEGGMQFVAVSNQVRVVVAGEATASLNCEFFINEVKD